MFEYEISDVELAVTRLGDPEAVYAAARRLMDSDEDDIRVIAAQAIVRNPFSEASWIEHIIENENNSEVRGWLYIALACRSGKLSLPFINKTYKSQDRKFSQTEEIFINSALAIAESSRFFLLEVMKGILSDNDVVSETASTLSRMLINENSSIETSFIEILEQERSSQSP